MGHHRGHSAGHHHQSAPTVVPTPAVQFHGAAPCETTPLVGKSNSHGDKGIIFFFILLMFCIMIFSPSKPTIPTPEIGLKSFSVSNLTVTDDQISANWGIGLGLCNRDGDSAANYTDIKYTVIYCGDPSGQYVVDARREYGDLVLPRNNQTVVYLKDSVEKLDFNKVALSYMVMDVASDGILEFDLVAKVTVMTGKGANYRLMLSCVGLEVSISDTHNGSGSAKSRQKCHVAKVK